MSINLRAQTCYQVTSVENKTENPDLNSKKFTSYLPLVSSRCTNVKKSTTLFPMRDLEDIVCAILPISINWFISSSTSQ